MSHKLLRCPVNVIVGETTGGSTGQPLMVSLPGGGTARICTKADTYPDGREWVGIGIKPGLEVHQVVAADLKPFSVRVGMIRGSVVNF